MTVATDAPARKSFFHYLVIPSFVYDDAYFLKRKGDGWRPIDLLNHIVSNVRGTDNCTLKRLQWAASLKELAELAGWTVKAVRYFLDKCQKLRIFGYEVGLKRGTAKGTSHAKITYVYQQLLEEEWARRAQLGAQKGQTWGDEVKNLESRKKEDIRPSQARDDDPFAPDPSRMASAGAGSSEAPGAGCKNPEPQPAESQGSSPPNSAAPPKLYPDAFDNLWKKVPKAAKRGGKAKPFAIWKKASAAVREQIERGVELWAGRDGDRTEFVPMAATWFGQRRWETEIETADDQPPEPRGFHDAYAEFEECPA